MKKTIKYRRVLTDTAYKDIKKINGHKCHHGYGLENANKKVETMELPETIPAPKGWEKEK